VTIAVSKREGTNAVAVVAAVMAKLETLRGTLVPSDVQVSVTRDYGESAAEKSDELLLHMGVAVVGVALLILIALGRREALIVMLAIPATLALTLTVFYLYGYTLNRITLFALIFSIGILVDDAIVVVENIARHYRLPENQGRTAAGDRGARHRRGGQPHHPRHDDRHRGHPAHGVRGWPDGPLHAPHPGGRRGGHDLLAGGRVRGHALGLGAPAEARLRRPRRPTTPTSRRAAPPARTVASWGS
jgi:hypothetical protein